MTALDDLTDEMALLLHAPCILESPDLDLIAFSGQGDHVDDTRRRSIMQRGSAPEVRSWFDAHGIRTAEGPTRVPGDTARGIVARLLVPARHRGRLRGYFWLLDEADEIDPALWPEAGRIAETAAGFLDLAERRQSHRDELYRAVVEGTPHALRDAAPQLAAAGGLRVDERVRCVVVDRPGLSEQLASRPSRPGVVWVRDVEGVSTAVVRSAVVDRCTSVDALLAALGLGKRLAGLDAATSTGVGPGVGSFEELTRSREGALVALRVSASPEAGPVARWDDLGPLALLGTARASDLREVVLPDLVRDLVVEHPELSRTAKVFLDRAGNVAGVADQLGLHRQTVYHRLKQVEARTGLDLGDGSDRLRLHLALLLAPFLV